ncbi:MAG: hypothetical protein JG777_2248 [Clostridia bacterium]|jgi:hypothetical protein|nr:hypothetical protein [Clostridia bacterium]
MIGIKKVSAGRMGNRLFHYHFLRQIAQKTEIEYFHCKFPDSIYFESMEKKSPPFFYLNRKTKISSKEILSYERDDFLNYIKEEVDKDRVIILNPPILGEVFFDYLFYPPSDFIRIKPQYKIDFPFDTSNKLIIGIHFRGTDFSEWNKHAALNFSYYRDAINYCRDYFKSLDPIFVLFTDDSNYPAFVETVKFLNESSKGCYYIGDNSSLPIYDFYQMSQCDVLISSPSTFAIVAGSIGKRKKIIHAKSWLDYAISKNDTFWVKLKETSNPYYSLWKTF